MYVSLIDGSTQVTYAALISPDGSTTPADSAYTNVTAKVIHQVMLIIQYNMIVT